MTANIKHDGMLRTRSDLIWNFSSTAVLACGGFLFSLLIALYYDPATLGVFNQAYAYYILLSQLTSLGVHIALAKYTAEYAGDSELSVRYLWTAVLCVLFISLVVTGLTVGILCLGGLIRHSDLLFSVFLTALALPMFSINKVILSYVNGLSHMRAYAVLQALRPILIACSIFVLSVVHAPGKYLLLCFGISESLLLLVSLIYLALCKTKLTRPDADAAKRLLRFGISVFPGNLILEFNTKIDVICLGLLVGSDYLVGVYSFAALFAEGFYQLFVVIRRVINPRIVQAYTEADETREKLEALAATIKSYLRFLAPIAAILLLPVYYVFCLLFKSADYASAVWLLAILAGFIALNGKSICLGNLLSDIGRPTFESAVNLLAALSNFCMNCVLIPFLGLYGAALATGFSYCVFAFVQRVFIRKHLGYSL